MILLIKSKVIKKISGLAILFLAILTVTRQFFANITVSSFSTQNDPPISCCEGLSWQHQLKYVKQVELEYRGRAEDLSPGERDSLNQFYYRDVALHWGSVHGLLPQGKPLPHVSCLRYLDTKFTVSVSVVMCMRNELIYLLLRTLTTIVRRTPKRLLHEIVLIDDGSDFDALPEIRNYSSQLNIPLKILRNNKSVGITSCRRYGIEQA